MQIDWFTVVAQAVNFLVLVWLLKRFLYHPILDAIDAREKRIAAELADADTRKAEALQERDAFRRKNAEFDNQRDALLKQATEELKTERARLFAEARQESEALRAKQQDALRSEQKNLREALAHRTRDEVFAIARKTLSDLADASLEERMVKLFLVRLRELDDPGMAGLKAAFKASTTPLLVRTAFALPVTQRSTIEAAICEILGKDRTIKFETSPALLSGIELSADGQKIAWSIAEYLAAMEKSVDALLKSSPDVARKGDQ